MRYVTISMRTSDGSIHPVGSLIADQEGVCREKLLYVDALYDGDGVLFYRLRGDVDALRDRLDDHRSVIDYDVVDAQGPATDVYIYVRPGTPADALTSVTQKYALVVDTPIEYADDGRLLVTVAGTQSMLGAAYEEFPDDIETEIEEAGDYAPGHEQLLTALTDRQREVLETAVELGYYDVPRDATHDRIAGELDVASSTVDEHLRKAESRLFSALVG